MLKITATGLRQTLFRVMQKVLQTAPALIHYKGEQLVLLSHDHYKKLIKQKKTFKGQPLAPLGRGKICKPLDATADQELMDYMGLT